MPTLTTTVRRQGSSSVTTLPSEIVRRLGLDNGDTLAWVEDGFGGYRVSPFSADTAAALVEHEKLMQKYDSVFRALAK